LVHIAKAHNSAQKQEQIIVHKARAHLPLRQISAVKHICFLTNIIPVRIYLLTFQVAQIASGWTPPPPPPYGSAWIGREPPLQNGWCLDCMMAGRFDAATDTIYSIT